MSGTLQSVVEGLIVALPALTALLVLAVVRVRREHRERQAIVPVAAAVFVAISAFVLYRLNDSFASISDWSTAAVMAVENAAVVTIFIVIKFALLPLGKWLTSREAASQILEPIYIYEPKFDRWFVNPRLSNLRRLFRWFYWAAVVSTVALIALTYAFPEWPGFTAASAPALAALVIGEFYFVLDGLTRREYERNILGETDRFRRVANYAPLRHIYREALGDRILTDGALVSSNAPLDSDFKIGQLSRSNEPAERLVGTYFNRLQSQNRDVDVNLVDASLKLINGVSVVINNPFYPDLTDYLCLPAYYKLLQYKKVLIIAGRDSAVEDLALWMTSGLESISGVPDLWTVEPLTNVGTEGLDVGILDLADAHDRELLKHNQAFLTNVDLIILAEPARMISTGQLGLSLVLDHCSQTGRPAVAAFDGNHDGLVDALSHLLKVNITEVVASTLPTAASSEVVWEADGPHLSARLFPNVSRYLGVGTEIAAIALKYQVREVQWVGGDNFPVKDMLWIDGQYYAQINAFADLELSQEALGEALTGTSNPAGMSRREASFLVVEDENFNVFETLRRFVTRAEHVCFVNVISNSYLLRDYMVDNRELFLADPKAIPSIVPDFARTERNTVLRLLLELTTFGVRSDDLEREFEINGWSVPQDAAAKIESGEPAIMKLLRHTIKEHTGVTDAIIRRTLATNTWLFESEPDTYSIEGGSECERVIDMLSAAYVFVEDEVAEENRVGALLNGHVYQAMLPGQFVTYDGKYYEVQSIATEQHNHGVVLRRAADHIRGRRSYKQLRTYALSNIRRVTSEGAQKTVNEMQLTRCVAEIMVTSQGYIESTSRAKLGQGRRVTIEGLPERRYFNKSVLVINVSDMPDSVRKTLTHLLNELFVSVFPYAHDYVRALTADPDSDLGDLLDTLICEDDTMSIDQSASIVIVEDSMMDLGLLISVERYLPKFMEMIADYLAWNASPIPNEDDSESHEPFVPHFPDRPPASVPASALPWWKRWATKLWPFNKRGTKGSSASSSDKEASPDSPSTAESTADEESDAALESLSTDDDSQKDSTETVSETDQPPDDSQAAGNDQNDSDIQEENNDLETEQRPELDQKEADQDAK